MDFLNRILSTIRDTGRGLLFWLLVIIGSGVIIFALRGTLEQPAPLSEQPVDPVRDGTPTPPLPPVGSPSPAAGFPDSTPFPSFTPPPTGEIIVVRPEETQFSSVTPPGFNLDDLTRTPTPMTPPTRTPIVPHAWGAFSLVGVSESVGGEPEAIIAGDTHLFVFVENSLVSLDGVGAVAPVVTGRVALPERETLDIPHLAIAGNTLLVALQDAGLVVVDVSDPEAMRVLTTYWPEPIADRPELGPWRVSQVVVEGYLAYVLTQFCPPGCAGGGELAVVDVLNTSDPAGLSIETRFTLEASNPVLAILNPYLFVGDGAGRIHVWTWSGGDLIPVGEPVQLTLAEGAPAQGVDSLQPASEGWLHTISNGVWWTLNPGETGWHIAQGPVELYTLYSGGVFFDGRVLLFDSHLGGLRLMAVPSTATIQDLGAYGPAWGLSKTGYTQHFALSGTLIYAIDGNGSVNVLQLQGE